MQFVVREILDLKYVVGRIFIVRVMEIVMRKRDMSHAEKGT